MARKAAEADQFQVRLPPGMRERIKIEADKNGRSMNAELVARIEQSFDVPILQNKLALMQARSEGISDAYAVTIGIISEATGHKPAVMTSLADAIRSISLDQRTGLVEPRAKAVESIADAIRASLPVDEDEG